MNASDEAFPRVREKILIPIILPRTVPQRTVPKKSMTDGILVPVNGVKARIQPGLPVLVERHSLPDQQEPAHPRPGRNNCGGYDICIRIWLTLTGAEGFRGNGNGTPLFTVPEEFFVTKFHWPVRDHTGKFNS